MQYGNATQRPNRQKFFQAQRSAIAPVGIVAVVSMNTIMKKKSVITPTSLTAPFRKKPLRPMMRYEKAPGRAPAASVAAPSPPPPFSTAVPGPRDAYQP